MVVYFEGKEETDKLADEYCIAHKLTPMKKVGKKKKNSSVWRWEMLSLVCKVSFMN